MHVSEVLKHFNTLGYDIKKLRPDRVEKAPQFFGYQFVRDGVTYQIEVECTSRSLIEEFLCFPLQLQQEFWWLLARKVPVPGDQVTLETIEGRRGGRVVRLRSEPFKDTVINLLMTH